MKKKGNHSMTTTITSQSSTKKLSTLIREGAAIHPQTTCGLSAESSLDNEGHQIIVATCALGAAYVALIRGGSLPSRYEDELLRAYMPALFRGTEITDVLSMTITFPDTEAYVPTEREMSIYDAVLLLNDLARWTREEIASWLGSLGY